MIPACFPEARLVREAQRGEDAAVEALVLHYQRKAYAIARAIAVGSTAEPEDIVQEAFFQALRDLPRLRQPECFGRWLLQIVRNVARRALRKEPITLVSGRLDLKAAPTPESLEHAEIRACLWREVSKLPERIREAIFLYYHEGETVREVAGALAISETAARKRLQNGRDLLRERLWRELGDSLRDLLPGARSWERQGRRLALVLLAALPARAAPAAAALGGSAAAGLSAGSSTTTTSSALLTGGLLMTKSGLLLAATAVLGIGAAMWLLRDLKGTASPAAPLIGASGTISAEEHRSLLVRYDGAVSRQQALERENAALRRRLEELGASGDGAAVAAEGAADGAPAESTGIDWSAYSRLLRQNLELLDRNHLASGLTDAEIASLTALEGELLRISGRARALSPAPLFDAAIFTELTRSLFKDALGLSDEQFAAVDDANRALFESLPEDLDALTPLERFRLKQGMAGHVWDAVEGVLDDEQRQHWEPVRKYSERLFREGQLSVTGLDLERPDVQVLFQLRDAYGLTGEQAESVRPWVPDYIQSAREIMARYAATKEELDALAISGRRALETEFLDLQERHERQILPLLGEEQRRKALAGEPRILHFSYGNSVMGNAYGPGLF